MKGKTVVITGASSGFGAAFAKAFAKEGARLVNIARRKTRLDDLEKELTSLYGTHVLSIELDIADRKAVEEKLGKLPDPFSSPDILINNAGLVRSLDKVWETSPADCDEMIDINIKGLLNVSAQIIPPMVKAGRGHIINLGSVSSHETYPGGGIYCATKWAVKAITETLRKELVASPVRVSMISPGMAKTEFSAVRFRGDEKKAEAVYENFQPLLAEDIAEIALFIASRPPHVAIADVLVFPTHQASVSLSWRPNQ